VRCTAEVGPIVPHYKIAPDTFQPIVRRSRETGELELVMVIVPDPRHSTSQLE
jgi:hypothetical protein